MIKLSIVVGVLDQHELTKVALRTMLETLERPEETELIAIDNGSEERFTLTSMQGLPDVYRARAIRNPKNVGNYPVFKQGLKEAEGEIVAFLHSDVFVYQKGWDVAVRAQFEAHPDLGLVGFIGSTEMDNWGGRGSGTVSNMQGRSVAKPDGSGEWRGSAGHIHGKVSGGMTIDGSVVDGCVMIFRKAFLEEVGFKEAWPIHHHYDRLMSAQMIERGWKVGILGIEFDHISGQVANHVQKYQDTAREWFKEHLHIDTPQQWADKREEWVKRGRGNPSAGKVPDQWDYATYLEAEYQFLKEYRDEKRIVPAMMGRPIGR